MAIKKIEIERVKESLVMSEVSAYPIADDVYLSIIEEQCDKVNSYVNASPWSVPRIKTGVSAVPEECVAAALAMIRYTVLSTLPGNAIADITTGSPRSTAYSDALRHLEAVARGDSVVSFDAEEGVTEPAEAMAFGGNPKRDYSKL